MTEITKINYTNDDIEEVVVEEEQVEMSESALALYIHDIRDIKRYSKSDQLKLWLEAQEGNAASREKLIMSLTPMIVEMAKSYRVTHPQVDLEDLIAAGNLGLCSCFDKYDATKNTKFSSWAYFWIKLSMMEETAPTPFRDLSIKYTTYYKTNKLLNYIADKKEKHIPLPPNRTIAKELRVSEKFVEEVIIAYGSATLTLDPEFSIDEVVDEESSVEKDLIEQENKDRLHQLLKTVLTEREYYLICRYHGLMEFKDNEKVTYDILGQEVNLTRERVRQLINQGLIKLKRYVTTQGLALEDFITCR